MSGSGPVEHPDGHPLVGRQRRMIIALRVALVLAAALATTGLVLPGEAGRTVAWGFVAVVVVAPVIRTMWLALRWWRRGDPRFAGVAVAVLAVVSAAALSAW